MLHAKSLQLCSTSCDPIDCSPPGPSVHEDSPGKNTGMGCLTLLQWIFLIQGSNLCILCLLHWQVDSLPQAPPGKYTYMQYLSDKILKDSEGFKKVKGVTDFIFLGSKITVGGDCKHEIKIYLLLGRKAMTNLDSI